MRLKEDTNANLQHSKSPALSTYRPRKTNTLIITENNYQTERYHASPALGLIQPEFSESSSNMHSINAKLDIPLQISGKDESQRGEGDSSAFKEVVISENLQGEQQYFSVPSETLMRSRQS